MDNCIVSSGESSNGIILDYDRYNTMIVLDGGIAMTTTVGDMCGLIISSGGTAIATLTSIKEQGAVYVSSGGLADYAVVNSWGCMYVSSGGTAKNAVLNSMGHMYISSGGITDNVIVNDYGCLIVRSGGTATNIIASNEADITFAVTPDTYVQGTCNGKPFEVKNSVVSGFTVNGCGGDLRIESAIAIDTTVAASVDILHLANRGIASNTTINFGVVRVSSGGTAIDTVISGGGGLEILRGGTARGTITCWNGRVAVFSGGSADNLTVNQGNSIFIENGAKATGIIENGGWVSAAAGAETSFVPNVFSGIVLQSANDDNLPMPRATVHSGTTANSCIVNQGSLFIYDGGIANDTTVNGGSMYVSSGGTANGVVVNNGKVSIASGGTLTGRIVIFGGNIYADGATLNFDLTQISPGTGARVNNLSLILDKILDTPPDYTITVNADQAEGVYTLAEGAADFNGTLTVVNKAGDELGTITVGGTTDISGMDYLLTLSDDNCLSLKIGEAVARLYTSDGLVLSGGTTSVESDETFHDTLIGRAGRLDVNAGGKVETATVYRMGNMDVSSDGVASDIIVHSGGRFAVSEGGVADNAVVFEGGALFVSSGGKAANIKENGGVVEIEDGADVSFASNVFSNVCLKSATLHSGTTACNTVLAGTMFVSSGAAIDDTLVCSASSGSIIYLEGGTANNTTHGYGVLEIYISDGGIANNTQDAGGTLTMYVSSGGTANSTILSRGRLIVSSGGTAGNTVVDNSRGKLDARAGAFLENTTINAGAKFTVSSGVTATNIIENGGAVIVSSGAEVSFASNTLENLCLSSGSATVHSGTTAVRILICPSSNTSAATMTVFEDGIANSTWVNPGGLLLISSGGTADNTIVNSGGKFSVSSGGTANNTTVNSQGSMYVSSGGTAENTTVHSNGRLWVSRGGKLTGRMMFESGADVFMSEGSILDFDLTQAPAEAGALLILSGTHIEGAPLYTLTVDDDLKPGSYVYSLADGAAEFNSMISVVNKAGDELGTLTVGETVRIGYNDYTLNLVESTLSVTVDAPDLTPQAPVGTAEQVSWEATGADEYIVEYSTDNFEHVIQIVTSASATDMLELPAGTYQWRVKADDNSDWAVGEVIVSEVEPDTPKVVQAVEDGSSDLFFATPSGTWSDIFFARHEGSVNDWTGTREGASANGKGRIRNLFFGTADPNVLCLTDAENGDGIFVDDIYTDLPDEVAEHTARLYRIREIRAGAGDDIVDMTSQRFEYTGDGLTIRGGDGSDVIWANKGDNMLFGDDGNDRIVGASGSDVIVGGIGNDSLHGGGGEDTFIFCDNWGVDTVEQLESGTITLWFANGDESNWNAETLTYADGENRVTVSGVSAEQITLKFGDDGSEQFAALSNTGAFDAFASRRIFEESDSGILAGV